MVCRRCIDTVKEIFRELEIPFVQIELGKVQVEPGFQLEDAKALEVALYKRGFELIYEKRARIVNEIKSLVIKQIHYEKLETKTNFSDLISSSLNKEYSAISKLFSKVEGRTIENFILQQKVERVKELITYDELSLTEIANKLGYSSLSHLSSQFKKVTGLSPSAYKN